MSKFWFPALTPSYVAHPPETPPWNFVVEGIQRHLAKTKGSSAITTGVTVGPWTATAGQKAHAATFVSQTLTAQTISGTVSMQLMVREIAAADNVDRVPLVIKIISGDGATVRATLYNGNGSTTSEFIANATHRNFTVAADITLTPGDAQPGDRIAVEVGFSNSNAGTTPEASAKWGENATDLPVNNTQTTNGAGWIDFSHTFEWQTFDAPSYPAYTNTAWNTTSPKTSNSVSVQTGDIIVVVAAGKDETANFTTPTNSGTALTWTLIDSQDTNPYPEVRAWQATASATESITVSVTSGGSVVWGVCVLVVRGSDGASKTAKLSSTSVSNVLLPTREKSGVFVLIADWAGVSGASRSWLTGAGSAVERAYEYQPNDFTLMAATHAQVGDAGGYTVGVSGFSGFQATIFAIELLGTVASSGVSGSGASQMGAATSTASGTPEVTGSATPGMGAATSSAAGTPEVTGSAADALGDFTSAGSGTVGGGVEGSGASQLGEFTSAGSGAPSVTGSAADSLGDPSSAASGTPIVSGQSASEMGAASSAAQGTPAITGSASGPMGAPVSAASGTPSVTGSAASAMGDATSAASGTVEVTSSGTSAMGSPVSAGSGSPQITGTAAADLGQFASTGQGTVGGAVDGSGASQVGDLTSSASGAPAVTGAGASSMGAATSQGAGSPAITGSAADQLGAPSSTGAGSPIVAGSAADAMGTATSAGAGSPVVAGTAADPLGTPVSTAQGAPIVAGSAADSLGSPTSVGAGSPVVAGSGAAAMGAPGSQGAGSPVVEGNAFTDLGGFTSAAAGAAGTVQAIDESLPLTVRCLTAARTPVSLVGERAARALNPARNAASLASNRTAKSEVPTRTAEVIGG